MGNCKPILTLIVLLVSALKIFGFSAAPLLQSRHDMVSPLPSLNMGIFDGITKAFTNADFKSQDQRVRASHILIKGNDVDLVLEKIKGLLNEIQQKSDNLPTIFSELAKRESQCPTSIQGGDLGLFGPGKMVKEFDIALFPNDGTTPPLVGSVIGPVVTDFGFHLILVTHRESNRDQVEEKLARIDTDAR